MSQKSKRRKAPPEGAIAPIYRAYGLTPRSVNEPERTVRALITTETPVLEWDWKRYELVPRILLTSGAQIPGSGQIPFLDSHNRFTTENQLGSARGLEKGKDGVEGDLHFSTTAERQWTMVREGHATDVSAGFQVLAENYVEAGQTLRIQGKDFTGPVNVAVKWRLYEVSLTPIGADDQAKLRGFDPTNIPQQDEDDDMTKEQRDLLLSRGMPADFEGEKAIQWALDNPDKLAQRTEPSNPGQNTNSGGFSAPDIVRELDRLAQEREKARESQRAAFRSEIDELCALADVPNDISRQLNWYECPDVQSVRTKIRDWKVEQSKHTSPGMGFQSARVTGDGRKAFSRDMLTHLCSRSFATNGTREATAEKVLPKESRGSDDGRWKHASLLDIARECLEMDGCDPIELRRLPATQVATAAMAGPESIGMRAVVYRSDDGVAHTTGSFAYLTENTLKKSLEAGYQDAPSTWETIMSIGQSFTDFKPKKIYTLSEAGNLNVWADGEEPDQTSMIDTRDSYGVEVYARSLTFSWQLLLNDDMNALTRAPAKLGAAARRTVNSYAWSLLTSNPTMRDGQALLLASATGNRKKANYITSGGGAPSVATVGVLTNLMRQQVGENTREGSTSPQILNLTPRYLVGPSALEVTINQLVNSAYDPSASINTQVFNPSRTLTPVIEPILDASSTTQWYLFADKSQIDTIEISFLAGHESPVVWSDMDTKTLTRWFAVRQGFGGKALHHQGVAANDGN